MITLLMSLAATFTPYYAYNQPTSDPHATHWFVYNDDPHLGTLECKADIDTTPAGKPVDCLVSPDVWVDVTAPGWALPYGPSWSKVTA